jgi:hypothetical protein
MPINTRAKSISAKRKAEDTIIESSVSHNPFKITTPSRHVNLGGSLRRTDQTNHDNVNSTLNSSNRSNHHGKHMT